jgi:succinoglycan exporter
VLVHATCNYLKTVTNNVGWSAPSKTTIFGLKFVTVPLLAPIVYRKGVDAVAIAG